MVDERLGPAWKHLGLKRPDVRELGMRAHLRREPAETGRVRRKRAGSRGLTRRGTEGSRDGSM